LLFAIFLLNVGNCFKFCDYKLFADDLKIYANVSSIGDSRLIQDDLDRLSDWCLSNGLKLNTAKCFKMSFSCSNIKINNDYYIAGDQVVEINRCQDLGLVFQPNLLFSSHIEYIYIYSKALRNLGFLIRNTKGFKNELCLKTFYTTLVRPILKFCSVLWNPSQIGLVESVERVQRLLYFIACKRKLDVNCNSTAAISLLSIQANLNVDSLDFFANANLLIKALFPVRVFYILYILIFLDITRCTVLRF